MHYVVIDIDWVDIKFDYVASRSEAGKWVKLGMGKRREATCDS